MEMPCRNLCDRYPAPLYKIGDNHFRPEIDVRRCQVCNTFLQWSGGVLKKRDTQNGNGGVIIERYVSKFHCPCCGTKLRSNPRHKQRNHAFNPLYQSTHS